jgi:hypothetical protein
VSAVQVTKAQAEARQPKRFKKLPDGFHDEAYMVSDDDDSVVYVVIKNDITHEVRCPCTWWCIHGRSQGKPCKHIVRYLAAISVEAALDPIVQQAGRIFDAVMHAIGAQHAIAGYNGNLARDRAVGVLAAELRAFVPPAGQTGSAGSAQDVFPGTSVRRIRF